MLRGNSSSQRASGGNSLQITWLRQASVSLVVLCPLALLLLYELQATPPLQTDFYTYLRAAAIVGQGSDPFVPVVSWITHYTGGPLRADYFVYAPFFAILLIPLIQLPLSMAVAVWGICNALFLLGTVICTTRAMGRHFPLSVQLVLTLGLMLLAPVRMELQWGQADIFLTFLISLSFLAARRNHPVWAGLTLALAIVVKPPLLGLGLFFLWKRDWRLVMSAALGSIVLFGGPFLVLGSRVLQEQFAIWSFWSSHYTPFIDNISPKGVFARLFTRNPNGPGLVNSPALAGLLWLIVVLGCLAIALIVIKRKTLYKDSAAGTEFALALCTLLLVSPLTEWIYLTLLSVPLLIWVSSFSSLQQLVAHRLTGSLVLLIYIALCLPLNHVEYQAWPHIAQGGLAGALAILVAATYLYPLLMVYGLAVMIVCQNTGLTLSAHLTGIVHESYQWYRRALTHASRSPSL